MFIISDEFIDCSYSLQQLGINNIAWTYQDIGKVIDYLSENDCIILDGDVYRINGHILESTCDSWYTNKTDLEQQDSIAISQAKSIVYINSYYTRNGNQYLYSLVFEKQS